MASLGTSLAPSMQCSSEMCGVVLLVPTYTSVLKLPLVNTIQEDCSPPTLRLHKGFDYIRMRMVIFLPYISGLKIFTEGIKSLLFYFFIFIHIPDTKSLKGHGCRESLSRAWGTGFPVRSMDECFWFVFAKLIRWFEDASRHVLQGCL